ncbi:hypothetical protein N7520_009418 [Penicillium odoratum]|uniref:uncharacterized protein n=1 Tax=Penicillium odoratum TaxID=1167516 RepID=UPI0025466E55|nr:uncharacterized protein N7520_009418 [Penicillium odoratum]KAJ5752501.1 hypothetical protein N7520_009418 [Penicillium odoratum]
MSRGPKPRKFKPIDPEKVREIEAKVQMLPDPRQLVNYFIDSRYVDLEDQIAKARYVSQEIFCSHVDDLKSLFLCNKAICERIEREYCKIVYRNIPKWTAAIFDVENTVARLRYEFLGVFAARLQDSGQFIHDTRKLIRREYLNPRRSARAKVDRLLGQAEDLRTEYHLLQVLGMAIMKGLNEIRFSLMHFRALELARPELLTLPFHEFTNVFEAQRRHFALDAHNHRFAWFERRKGQATALVESQLWSPKIAKQSLMESVKIFHQCTPQTVLQFVIRGGLMQGEDMAVRESARVHLSFYAAQSMIANRLRKLYTAQWKGPNPANSPKLGKVWRQLDVMALFETQQASSALLQYEVWLLLRSLEGKFGPMWSNLGAAKICQYHDKLHLFSMAFHNSRKDFATNVEMYRLANWARLKVEEKQFRLGGLDSIQDRGLLIVRKPLSQDDSLFNHWVNQYAAISFKLWTLHKILKIFTEENDAFTRSYYTGLAEEHLKRLRPPSFVPEIGSARVRDSRRKRRKEIRNMRSSFPAPHGNWSSKASTKPKTLSPPSKDTTKISSSSPLPSPSQALDTHAKASRDHSPPMSDTTISIAKGETPKPDDKKESVVAKSGKQIRAMRVLPTGPKLSKQATLDDVLAETSPKSDDERKSIPEEASIKPKARPPPSVKATKNPSSSLLPSSPPKALKTPPKDPRNRSPSTSGTNVSIAKGKSSKPDGKKESVLAKSRKRMRARNVLQIERKLIEQATLDDTLAEDLGDFGPPILKKGQAAQQPDPHQKADPESSRSPPAGSNRDNAVFLPTSKLKSRPAKKTYLAKRPRESTLGRRRNPLSGSNIQRKLNLDFLSGKTTARLYSTRACVSGVKANEHNLRCADEQSLPLDDPPSAELVDGLVGSAKDLLVSSEAEFPQNGSKVKDKAAPLFWTHSSQRGPAGQKLIVHYCRTLDSTEEVAKLFLDSKVIGFDMEWKAQASAWDSIQSNLSLIQVANEERIALFQIALFKPDKTLQDLVAPSLKQLLESPDVTKVGVSIKADVTRLRKYLGIETRSIFELSHLFRLVKYGLTHPKLVNKRVVNLSDQAAEHLGLPLEKSDDVRCGDWTRPLNYRQVQYAATDPYACICLFNTMNMKRQAMDSVPPLPAHADLNLPIILPPKKALHAENKDSLPSSAVVIDHA